MQRWSMGTRATGRGCNRRFANDAREFSGRPGGVRVGRAEHRHGWHASAEAMCMAPESLVRKTRQAAARSMNWRRLVWPAKLTTRARPAMRLST